MTSSDDPMRLALAAQANALQAFAQAQAQGILLTALIDTLRESGIVRQELVERVVLASAKYVDDRPKSEPGAREHFDAVRSVICMVATGWNIAVPAPGTIPSQTLQ